MAKAQYCSLLHERGPRAVRERVYKLLPTGTSLSLNEIIRLDSSVALVVDSESKSKKSHGFSRPRAGRSSKLRCDERSRRRRIEQRRRFLLLLRVCFVCLCFCWLVAVGLV